MGGRMIDAVVARRFTVVASTFGVLSGAVTAVASLAHRCAILGLAVSVLVFGSVGAQAQLLRFWDPDQGQWGYKRPDGTVAISPRYLGAGVFREGRAPVEDSDGFAIINDTGRVVERIVIDSVSAAAEPAPPPAGACAWSPSEQFPSTGLECYVRQLRRSAPVVGGEMTRRPPGGESSRSVIVLKLSIGVVVFEDIRYEGFKRRALLPGVSAVQALEWRRKLYPDIPVKVGCSESWSTGAVPGGAFIEQAAGC